MRSVNRPLIAYLIFLVCTFNTVHILAEAPLQTPATESAQSQEEQRRKEILLLPEADRRILRQGEISDTRYIIGGILGVYPGFGIGHIVQGQWLNSGWRFTAGEIGSLAVLVVGLADCIADDFYDRYSSDCNNGFISIGLISCVIFRVWEIVDVWTGVPAHNRRYRELKKAYGEYPVVLFVPKDNTTQLALQWSF